MYCEQCNTKVAQAMRICPKCGNRSFSEVITKKKCYNQQPRKTSRKLSSFGIKFELTKSKTMDPFLGKAL
mgnify:CR=1 FL=1